MQKLFLLTGFLAILTINASFAQRYSISGTVYDDKDGAAIIGANIYLKGTTVGAVTNKIGDFKIINVKPGDYELVVSYIGHSRYTEKLHVDKDISGKQFKLPVSKSCLGEVVVTGTSTPHHLKSAPVQTELISNKLIKQIAPSDFNDLMLSVSPSFDFSPGSMGAFMQLNGLGNDYILILIDGKRVYGDVGGQSDLSRINTACVKRIEVVKGASSALYGSEAMAGVVNIITDKSKSLVSAKNSTRFGSYGEWVQLDQLDINLGRFSSSTSYNHKESDGWQLSPYEFDGNDSLVQTDDLTKNPSSDYTFSQKFTYSPTQKLTLYTQGESYHRKIEKPLTVSKYGYVYKDLAVSAGGEYLLNNNNRIQLDATRDNFDYYYRYNQEYKDYSTNDEVLQTKQIRDAAKLNGIFHLSKQQLLTLGAEYVNEQLESEGRLEGESASAYTIATYAQDEVKVLKMLTLVAGLRYVNHKEFGNAVTPKISALYRVKNINLRGTYAWGFKAPTLKELYYHYQKSSTLYLGNPDLKPQTSDYYSLSAEYHTPILSLSLTVYQNNLKDMIDYETIETSAVDTANGVTKTRQHYNISEAQTRGLDFVVDLKFGHGLSMGGGYSYVEAKNLTDGAWLEGVAKNYGNVRVSYLQNLPSSNLLVSLSGRFQDEKYYTDGNSNAYDLWKLSFSNHYNLNGYNLEFKAGIDNLFDYVDARPYGSNYGTISPGRTFFVGLDIEWSL